MKPVAFGKYTLLRRLARGGMAELFLARAGGVAGVERLVVIKLVAGCHARDPSLLTMFADEARIASMLDHPNIGQVLDVGEVSGQYYLAMEYLHGKNLQDIIEAIQASGQTGVPTSVAVYIAAQVCSALHFAHNRGGLDGQPMQIIHRDVSPSNIMVTYHGNVKLLDFGIARATNRNSLTRPGRIKGKVRYLSPEQAWGRDLDQRTDLFSLGICLWECTVGRFLFDSDDQAKVLEAVTSGQVPAPSRIVSSYPPQLEAIVMKALAFEAKHRYATARDMHVDLEQFARQQRLPLSELDTARFMGDTFSEEASLWQTAQQRGTSLLDHLLATVPDSAEAGIDILDTADDLKTLPPRGTSPSAQPPEESGGSPDNGKPDTGSPDTGSPDTGAPHRRTAFFAGPAQDTASTPVEPPQLQRKTVLFGSTVPAEPSDPDTHPDLATSKTMAAASLMVVAQAEVDPPHSVATHETARSRVPTPLRVSTERRVAITPDGNAKVESFPTGEVAANRDLQPTLVTGNATQPPPGADGPTTPKTLHNPSPQGSATEQSTVADIELPGAADPQFAPTDAAAPDAIPSRRQRPRTGDWAHQASTLEQRPGTHPYFRSPELPPARPLTTGETPQKTKPFGTRTLLIGLAGVLVLGVMLLRTNCHRAPEAGQPIGLTAARPAVLRITSEPTGATVFSGVTGQELGRTPLTIDVVHVEGQRLEIHLPGYETTSLIVVKNKRRHHATLRRTPTTIPSIHDDE